jgi:hypothetical protein
MQLSGRWTTSTGASAPHPHTRRFLSGSRSSARRLGAALLTQAHFLDGGLSTLPPSRRGRTLSRSESGATDFSGRPDPAARGGQAFARRRASHLDFHDPTPRGKQGRPGDSGAVTAVLKTGVPGQPGPWVRIPPPPLVVAIRLCEGIAACRMRRREAPCPDGSSGRTPGGRNPSCAALRPPALTHLGLRGFRRALVMQRRSPPRRPPLNVSAAARRASPRAQKGRTPRSTAPAQPFRAALYAARRRTRRAWRPPLTRLAAPLAPALVPRERIHC